MESLTSINNWPAWQKNITETVVHGNIQEGTAFDWKAGGLSFKSKIHTSIPQSGFGWTGTTFGASAIYNWTFEAKGNTTIVKVQESLQGVFPKLFRGSFQKNLDSSCTMAYLGFAYVLGPNYNAGFEKITINGPTIVTLIVLLILANRKDRPCRYIKARPNYFD